MDSSVIMDQYKGMVEARKDYQVKADAWQANIDTLQSEIEKLIQDYTENQHKLSGELRADKEAEINRKQEQFYKYREAIAQKAQEEDQKLTEGVVKQINSYLEEYGKENKYSIIFGTTSGGSIVYGDDATDITSEVLKGMNEEYTMGKL